MRTRSRTTPARFLYVEAHNKGVIQTGTGNGTGRTLALSFAGADGVFGAATNMGVFRDTDPTPDVYMYHRQLIRLTGAAASIPADQMTVRVAAVATAGGPEVSSDTFKVTEWVGSRLPPHVANYQKGFFNRYQDPTENRANLDALAAEFPNLVTAGQPAEPDERLPAQVAGDHERHDRHRRGPADHARPRHLLDHGRDHGRAAGRQHPVHRHRGADRSARP